MNNLTKILIADDHQLFLDGLKLIFSNIPYIEIVAEAQNGTQVIAAFELHQIDIAILDVNMPKPNGFETCKLIQQKYPKCKVIILTMYNENAFIREFFKSGASAYILKNAGKAELLNAIEKLNKGEKYISKELEKDFENMPKDDFVKTFSLTPREIEIICMLGKGINSTEISEKLFLSAYTVITHRKNILKKLSLKNTAELMSFAYEKGLL
jgi:two-component system nitrate/nitrite response regulator NarL